MKSRLLREIRENHHLLTESRGGCALIENKHWVAELTGDHYEDVACRFLQEKGYALVQRRYKRGGGEIDIICQDGDAYVFCEVKARSNLNFGAPETFVNEAKQEKIIQTAQKYMAEKALFKTGRFDVIAIDILKDDNYDIRHYVNAFPI